MDVSSCLAVGMPQYAQYGFGPVGEKNSCLVGQRSFSELPIIVDRIPYVRRVDRLETQPTDQLNFRDSASSNTQRERTKKTH